MIENREQRKKASLFRRRIIFISIFTVALIALCITLAIVYNFVNTVIYFTDTDDAKTEYLIKNVNGVWAMYDKDDKLLEKESNFNCYVTKAGTLVRLNEETGKYNIQASLEISGGELASNTKILIFKHISEKNIRSIEVHNEKDSYTFYRYNITDKKLDDTAAFVYKDSPQLTIRRDALTALASDVGYALAASRVEKPMLLENGKIDLAEYGLAPEKRTRTVVDENGNETIEEYDYTPAYYVMTTINDEKYKMLIGDRLVNGGGYYAQYIEITKDGKEIPREKVYVFASSLSSTVLAEAKNFITPGITYPATTNDYFDVVDFEIKKLNSISNEYDKMVGFTYIDNEERKDTAKANKPYVFNDERSSSYHPNFDRIDSCLLSFVKPEIVDTVALAPSKKTLSEYGLTSPVLDENGNPVLDEYGQPKYVFSSKYVISFKRSIKLSSNTGTNGNKENSEIDLIQTIYISDKNESGNHYSYTVIDVIGDSKGETIGVDLDMICEVKSSSLNFLSYSVSDWTYPAFMETGIKYATKLTLQKDGYSATFDINNLTYDGRNGISINASNSLGEKLTTFGMINAIDAGGGYTWYVSRVDVKLLKGDKEYEGGDMDYGVNALGERTKYLKKPFLTSDGRKIYVDVNTIKIVHPGGKTEEYVRYHTMIFQKLFQNVNSMRIAGEYSMENEEAFIADPANYYATIELTNNEDYTIKADFYKVSSRKYYVVVNGEGGYYINASSLDKIFENSQKFFRCEDFQT